MRRRINGTLCVGLMGFAALTWDAPRLIRAQELPPAQRVPRPAPLDETRWMLAESNGHQIAQDGRQPYFDFKSFERYQGGSAGALENATDSCGNHLVGFYRTTGDWLHVRILASTALACKVTEGMPPGLGAVLDGDQRFRIRGGELDLVDNNGEVRARFVAADAENNRTCKDPNLYCY